MEPSFASLLRGILHRRLVSSGRKIWVTSTIESGTTRLVLPEVVTCRHWHIGLRGMSSAAGGAAATVDSEAAVGKIHY